MSGFTSQYQLYVSRSKKHVLNNQGSQNSPLEDIAFSKYSLEF